MSTNFITSTFLLFYSVIIFSQSPQQFYEINNFITVKNDTIKNCKVGYRTFGTLNERKSNAVIYCSWFRGTSEAIGNLIEKRNFVDTSAHFIIAFDALGNGVSSSPSNYKNGTFPDLTIRDMVNAQYIVVTEQLQLKALHGAIGGSMGSMQVLEWSVAYPQFIDKIAAYVCSPKLSSYDLLWMKTQLQIIESLTQHKVQEHEIKRLLEMTASWISRSPDHLNQNVKTEDFYDYLQSFNPDTSQFFSAENYASQLKAMITHDISKNFDGSFETASAEIKSKLLLIVSRNDLTVNPASTLKLAELLGSELIILDNNCGHLAVSCEFERVRMKLKDFFNELY